MFIIVETTQYKNTQNVTTSFGKNLYYGTYDEVEKDFGQLIACNLPEGEVATIIRQADAVTLDLPDKLYTISIETLNKKEGDN